MDDPKFRPRWTIRRLMVVIVVLALDFALVAPFARSRQPSMPVIGAFAVIYLNALAVSYAGFYRKAREYQKRGRRIGPALGGCLLLITLMILFMAISYLLLLLNLGERLS